MNPKPQQNHLFFSQDGSMCATSASPAKNDATILTSEDFAVPQRAGTAVASHTQGSQRRGVDLESVISVDNRALRIKPLIDPGWGRAGVAYGPFQRRNGRAFAVFMVNGHNTSQSENLTESFRGRLDRWLRGPDLFGRPRRLLQWLLSKRKGRMPRQWKWWWRIAMNAAPVPRVDENLAIGWFASEVPVDPLAEGNGFVMHATGAENGEL